MTTLEQFLSECERLDKEATPGPWAAYCKRKTVAVDIGAKATGRQPCIVKWPGFDGSDLSPRKNARNAKFIAHSRTALPVLVKMLRELQTFESTSDMKALLGRLADDYLKEAKV